MAIYRTGTAALSAEGKATGTGTAWTTPLSLIRVGATVIFLSGDKPVLGTISEIVSDTEMNLTATGGETSSDGDYAILIHDSLTVEGLAQDISEALRYYQGAETEMADLQEKIQEYLKSAQDSATASVNSAAASKQSADASAASASSSEASASAAKTSETNAANKATAADNSAKAAANSQSAAKTSENNASASASSAASSAQQASSTLSNAVLKANNLGDLANRSIAWSNLLSARTPATARSDLGLGALSLAANVSPAQLNSDLARWTPFSNGRNSSQGAGVYTVDNTPWGYEQYGLVIQLSNQNSSSNNSGSGVWQHYLQLGTNRSIVYAKNVNGVYSTSMIYSTANTTVDGSGFIKAASPIARVSADVSAMQPGFIDNGFEISGDGAVNEEARGVLMSRKGVGVYEISGSIGLHSDGWQIEVPKDINGNRLCFVDAKYSDGVITLNVFKPKLDLDTGGIIAGDAIDIPEGRWVDLRLDMPEDSVYNKSIRDSEQINEQLAWAENQVPAYEEYVKNYIKQNSAVSPEGD